MKLTTGQVLQNGKYVLDTVLSQSGFAITYRAHTYLAQTVVLKTLSGNLRSYAGFDQFQQQFIAEAHILAGCRHPNIIRVSDFFKERGLPFMVMDYVPGKTLAEIISDHLLTEAQAIHYIRQIGAALGVIHQSGLLPRDIKPQNIILRQGTQSVVLIDFGIAHAGATQNNRVLLAGYAAIEQYLPQYQWTSATDVYTLAATLYALLAGQPPIPAVLRNRIPLLDLRQFQPHLSPAVEQAILQGMALKADHRPQKIADWLALLPYKTWEPTRHSISSSFPGSAVTLTSRGETGGRPLLPVHQSPGPHGSKTATASPKPIHPTTTRSQVVYSPSRRSLSRALMMSSVIATIIGGGFGLFLRFREAARPGFPVNLNQSFPPKEMPGTTMLTSPSPVPSLAAPTEEAAIQEPPVNPNEMTTVPSKPASSDDIESESAVSFPSEDFPSSTSVAPTPPLPEPSASADSTSEPTVDLDPPATQDSEPTPAASLTPQEPQIPAL